ncbi:MAG: hypothetical protein JWR12_1502 [Mucilaginibacter sp.]|nr:hypothetical protein [Mucilaginibacter sp.]
MKIDFKSEKSPYDPEFVEKVLQGREDIKNGKDSYQRFMEIIYTHRTTFI